MDRWLQLTEALLAEQGRCDSAIDEQTRIAHNATAEGELAEADERLENARFSAERREALRWVLNKMRELETARDAVTDEDNDIPFAS